jgi:methylaspartate mutase epsilon subunit
MGPFPRTESCAFALIAFGALTAALARATKVITKTTHEAFGVPTQEANANGLLCSRLMVETASSQYPLDQQAVEAEAFWISRETTAIIDRALELGEGDVEQSVIRAFEAGVIDVPFCPSVYAKNSVIPIRDAGGAVRYLECGSLPLDADSLKRNRMLVRRRAEKGEDPLTLVEEDINYFLKGEPAPELDSFRQER